jgi:hypothetical protein
MKEFRYIVFGGLAGTTAIFKTNGERGYWVRGYGNKEYYTTPHKSYIGVCPFTLNPAVDRVLDPMETEHVKLIEKLSLEIK